MAKKNQVRKAGRPAVYVGKQKESIVKMIAKLGLTGTRNALADKGTNISLPTLGKFAKEAKIKLQAGRPPMDGSPVKSKKKPAKGKAKAAAKPAAPAKKKKSNKPKAAKPAVTETVVETSSAPVAEAPAVETAPAPVAENTAGNAA